MVNAVHYFFMKKTMLHSINHTFLMLISKVKSASGLRDYRPISCIGVAYKLIAKVIAERLKIVLPELIAPKQTAFLRGRRIEDNICLTRM